MAEKKRVQSGKTAGNGNKKSGAAKSASSNKVSAAKREFQIKEQQRQKRKKNPDSVVNQVIPYILGLSAIAVVFCFLFTEYSGFVGQFVNNALFGLLGMGAAAIPAVILIEAFLWRTDIKNDSLHIKSASALIVILSFSVIMHIAMIPKEEMTFAINKLWIKGLEYTGGGVFGGFVGTLFVSGLDKALSLLIFIPLFVIFTLFMFGLTPHSAFVLAREKMRERREAEEEYYDDDDERVWHSVKEKNKLKIDESALEDEESPVDTSVFDEAMREKKSSRKKAGVDVALEDEPPFDPDVPLDELAESIKNETANISDGKKTENDIKVDLEEIFADSENAQAEFDGDGVPNAQELDLMVERKKLQNGKVPADGAHYEPPEIKEYVFPPISYLNIDTSNRNEDVSEEMRSTAIKLVETLRSFKVRTRIVDVSRGPTITRYELAPEEGVRVRTIANLLDDISLNLATSGVRIEAPIPGKAAVGIEVPNKVVATVYLRELLENPYFKQAKSRVTVGLGVDVAGTPIYVDIAKMPHLLIAGATGMGKSVCINSMIVSLLYKATPDEVKLILIDPKKVELSIYNSLPHLLVPVVTDPKKAAGSLHWAVTEMDRRFELIEDVGVRDIAGYNRITKDDPDREFLPQIVIIIDELADLMMTAPDDVEASICRLAQKARAAGMHLMIGTQRPSVDVVTGLIKANVPSRIAFTMASQVDSRTIIDISGAEKLIGRGDMLYAPVGITKPSRVQGAFVSEAEIEKIVEFIKKNSGVSSYDSSVIESIEKEAAKCGMSKKGHGGELDGQDNGDDDDPLYKAAVELAVESGKISTSLLQRRLSVGYGRAAKLIDKMETRGIVSAPEGQKPRTVLISRQQYLEMQMKQDE